VVRSMDLDCSMWRFLGFRFKRMIFMNGKGRQHRNRYQTASKKVLT
jgi:hypothetical protein